MGSAPFFLLVTIIAWLMVVTAEDFLQTEPLQCVQQEVAESCQPERLMPPIPALRVLSPIASLQLGSLSFIF